MSTTPSSRFAGAALVLAGMLAAAALPASCSRKPVTDRGAGGGGGLVIDGGGGSGGGGAIDGGPIITDPPDALPDVVPDLLSDLGLPFSGLRSYTVTAALQRQGGSPTIPPPDSHTFTLVLDADRRVWIAGVAAEGKSGFFEPTSAGTLHITGPASFRLAGCPGSSVLYNELTITIDASNRMTGTGRGRVTVVSGDIAAGSDATITLTGTTDVQSPALALAGDAADPFASFAVTASEPLQPAATAVLRATDGETIALSPGGEAGTFVTLFQKPAQVLRFATQYQILPDGITDFAGNPATASALTFTTRPQPPLSPEDGFESVTGTTFGGAQVLSSASAPTIAGGKSLYIAASTSTQPVLAVRLALAAGDTVVRFSYRTVRPSPTSFGFVSSWLVGSVGGEFAVARQPTDDGATTSATIDGASVTLGPIMTASFPLPAGAANEVVLQRTPPAAPNVGCGLPRPISWDGIIIDDLRVE